MTSVLSNILKQLKLIQWQILSGPLLILIILSMMVLPLAPFILDIFFTFNIALSIVILLVSMFTIHTLEFTAFPIILLFSTLLRLALNIASTRIILLYGHIGSHSAGNVIQAFGHFLVGGNFAIGIIVFIILVIINFMVITKGAGRIAEVGARFILDGMPGKQMAIDADLNAGLIREEQAKKRRLEITQEADFYGSMDGASKFVRGDAIAGILIMGINIVGGLIVGVLQHGMLFTKAVEVYTILTIGDGLVAQIPALVISTASGVIVTRVSTDQNVSEQMISQLFYNPKVVLLSGVVLGIFGLVPGMPNIIFLFFTSLLFLLSWLLYNNPDKFILLSSKTSKPEFSNTQDATWNDVQLEDSIGIELGSKLVPMVKENEGEDNLLYKIRNVRKQCAKEIGFLPPLIHIRNNIYLFHDSYRILIKGIEIGKGIVKCNQFLAIDPENKLDSLSTQETTDPTFNFRAFWIEKHLVNQARLKGYNIVKDSTVISTHLNKIILDNTSKLFGRQEAQQLLDYVGRYFPKLVEDLIPNIISLTTFHKVIKNLLAEHVPIRDMQTILETLIINSASYQNNESMLTSVVRIALQKLIVQKVFKNNEFKVIGLGIKLENILLQTFQSEHNNGILEPKLYNYFLKELKKAIDNQILLNNPIVLLVNHKLRMHLSQILLKIFPNLIILSNLELEENHEKIYFTSTVAS
ncbi:flagellar biosynthesis protein FlhA [Buchnera aphidicola]|uniref:Flagellar biosynthesis protein FlhA n=1 Tax=Buchnera aphidicola subsp. Melaphis rhois TaxID=118103 RepID=A0A4D6Y189_BUCMH|nr:flagellar biosynthesis protein FlhA [Buchnera aphidicola]QCI23256.1 flagellar biosynthesis protein FlhA [Buchnera aphidicola (Melaphis rhois)]